MLATLQQSEKGKHVIFVQTGARWVQEQLVLVLEGETL